MRQRFSAHGVVEFDPVSDIVELRSRAGSHHYYSSPGVISRKKKLDQATHNEIAWLIKPGNGGLTEIEA